MNRAYAIVLTSLIAVVSGACDDHGGSSTSASGPSGGGPAGSAYGCGAYTTCASCTPIPGCGWCFRANRSLCASDPDQCGNQEFTWTWDPSGCPDVDAAVVPLDAQARD
jgi:hypothetical protein